MAHKNTDTETHDTPITLPGYQPFIAANAPHGVSMLVRHKITAIEHDLHDRRTEHLFIELIPHKKRTDGIFILNIYNAPSLRHSRFLTLFKKALNAAGSSPLVIGGDFNLPHTGWGYKHCSAAGQTKTHGQDHVTNTLCQKYIPSGPAKPHGPYTGSSNSALDEDFSLQDGTDKMAAP
ncbi:hypothetical protein HPB49_005158 [Dermacentor silvarum]|uniref:Uncharacterized protein n=1 Tax=Dermacentor silvarum TaxID=543639 RepID=A0ACB8CQ56_DERSI|nr:hypothetical protein HPB49_005158 [Dermacentor silvarum]